MREWRCGFGIDDHLSPDSAMREHIVDRPAGRSGSRRTVVEQLGIRLYWELGKRSDDQFFSDSH